VRECMCARIRTPTFQIQLTIAFWFIFGSFLVHFWFIFCVHFCVCALCDCYLIFCCWVSLRPFLLCSCTDASNVMTTVMIVTVVNDKTITTLTKNATEQNTNENNDDDDDDDDDDDSAKPIRLTRIDDRQHDDQPI